MTPQDMLYKKVASRETDPKDVLGVHETGSPESIWARAGLYVTLALARIAKIGPATR